MGEEKWGREHKALSCLNNAHPDKNTFPHSCSLPEACSGLLTRILILSLQTPWLLQITERKTVLEGISC